MGLEGCPETPVEDYHSTLRNIPEERRSQVLREYYKKETQKEIKQNKKQNKLQSCKTMPIRHLKNRIKEERQ
jgi:hypothetical protein